MIFSQKLQILRKNKGMTQEALAERLDISRQAVAKWECGQGYPDIANLILISDLFNVTVDYLVRDGECMAGIAPVNEGGTDDIDELIAFRLEANVNTYAACMNKAQSTRLDSHDFCYQSGRYTYHDTYVGGEQFAGEEAIWKDGKSAYAMNYMGRVLQKEFSGNFLKDALRHASKQMPYRGPDHYSDGEYTYKCTVTGDFSWFQGYEEIFWNDVKVYECFFHGGAVR